jgi:hypothetical protein
MLILVTSEDHLRSASPTTTPSLQANDGIRKQTRHSGRLRLHVSEQPDPFILTITYDILLRTQVVAASLLQSLSHY